MGRPVLCGISTVFFLCLLITQAPVRGKVKKSSTASTITALLSDSRGRAYHRLTGPEEIPRAATTLDEFLVELKDAVDRKALPLRPLEFLFADGSFVLQCYGDWMEFGVATGGSITLAANWRRTHCGPDASPVYGFDTFTGLPEDWDQGKGGGIFGKGRFSLDGKLPPVPENAKLIKGLFGDSLPNFLAQQRNGRWVIREATKDDQVTYLHIDCDLYQGAIQALTLLTPRLRPGTVLLFDDLINYNRYREHEVRALWEWLTSTGHRLRVIGAKGPLTPERPDETMDLSPELEYDAKQQSVAFMVL